MSHRLLSGLLCAAAALVIPAMTARADEYLDSANRIYASVQADKRSDTILLPLLAKLQDAPSRLDDLVQAAMTPATAPGFDKLAEWAQAEPQKALLEGIKKATVDDGRSKSFEFAQPYGATAADPDMVMIGMYTELGDPPLMAQADIKWLPKVHLAFALMQVEATRLAAAGTPKDAMDLLVNSIALGRQIANRGSRREKTVGMDAMIVSLMRIRDLAYEDFRSGSPKMTAEQCRDVIGKLKEPSAIIDIARIELPAVDRIAAQQLFYRIMKPTGETDPEAFGMTLARLSSRDRPLRLFSEQARWEAIAKFHAGAAECRKAIDDVFGDWNRRWRLSPWDPALKQPTDYAKLSRTRFAVVDYFLGDMARLFEQRLELRVELIGTRTALGHYGFWLQNRRFAPDASAVRPAFIAAAQTDPFDPKAASWLTMAVPGRGIGGQQDPSGQTNLQVFAGMAGRLYPQFQLLVKADQFILYSMGPKGFRGSGTRFTQLQPDAANNGDYLVWPPMMSLVRKREADQGRWK